MPRRRKGDTTTLPPRSLKLPVAAVFNPKLSHPAFRLLAIVTAYSFDTGWCDLNNQQLADLLGVSRQFVSRLLRDLSANDLVSDTTLAGDKRKLTPVSDDSLPWRGDLVGRGLFEPVDRTIEQQAPLTGGRASRSSRTPHKSGLSTEDNTVLSTRDNLNAPVVEEQINKKDSSTTTKAAGMSTRDNIKNMLPVVDKTPLDQAFARVAARWVNYFEDISPVEADLVGDFLDDPPLIKLAQASAESPDDWLIAAIEETALAKAKTPAKYFRTVLTNWINRGYRTPPQGESNAPTATPGPKGTSQANPGNPDRTAAIIAILDQLDSGRLSPDDARRQLAAYGHVL
jgi:hypothetical protein